MVVFVERDFAVADSRRDHAKNFFIAFFFSHFKNYLKSTQGGKTFSHSSLRTHKSIGTNLPFMHPSPTDRKRSLYAVQAQKY